MIISSCRHFFYLTACSEGYNGQNCSHVCSSNCRTCNPTDGTCNCYPGWMGSNCNIGNESKYINSLQIDNEHAILHFSAITYSVRKFILSTCLFHIKQIFFYSTADTLLKYCRYGVKRYPINQSFL